MPFGGFGRILRLFGWQPSAKNPQVCGFCSQRLPAGGCEVEVAVFVADVRGYTALSETIAATELAATMSRYFTVLTDVLLAHGALIDKYMGDGLQALFLAGVAGAEYERQALDAARASLVALDKERCTLPVGIAIHSGIAFVGNVGGVGMVDLTAMGDVVNVANRLQAFAQAGEILVGEHLYQRHAAHLGTARKAELSLKGKETVFAARVISVLT